MKLVAHNPRVPVPYCVQRLRRSRQADLCPHTLCLYVRWHSTSGGVRITRLPLNPIGGVADLRGLFRRLIQGAFGSPAAQPDYLTSPSFYKFAPAEELISLPADIARTEFRLAVTLNGWEYTVCERTLPGTPDPERKLLVTVRWPGGGRAPRLCGMVLGARSLCFDGTPPTPPTRNPHNCSWQSLRASR